MKLHNVVTHTYVMCVCIGALSGCTSIDSRVGPACHDRTRSDSFLECQLPYWQLHRLKNLVCALDKSGRIDIEEVQLVDGPRVVVDTMEMTFTTSGSNREIYIRCDADGKIIEYAIKAQDLMRHSVYDNITGVKLDRTSKRGRCLTDLASRLLVLLAPERSWANDTAYIYDAPSSSVNSRVILSYYGYSHGVPILESDCRLELDSVTGDVLAFNLADPGIRQLFQPHYASKECRKMAMEYVFAAYVFTNLKSVFAYGRRLLPYDARAKATVLVLRQDKGRLYPFYATPFTGSISNKEWYVLVNAVTGALKIQDDSLSIGERYQALGGAFETGNPGEPPVLIVHSNAEEP